MTPAGTVQASHWAARARPWNDLPAPQDSGSHPHDSGGGAQSNAGPCDNVVTGATRGRSDFGLARPNRRQGRDTEARGATASVGAETDKAVKTLISIMDDAKAADAARAAAANSLLDRGWGRPAQTISGDPENPHKLIVEIIDPTRPE